MPPYVEPTEREIEKIRLAQLKELGRLRNIDFRKKNYTGQLNYPPNYVEWMGRRGPGFREPLIPRFAVDTVMRIESHDQFMGRVVTSQNLVFVTQMAKFRNVDFNCYVNFSNVTFKEGFLFMGVNFNGATKMENLRSLKHSNFTNIRFKDPLVLNTPNFEEVNFNNIHLDGSKIELINAKFKKLMAENIKEGHFAVRMEKAREMIITKSHFNRLTIEGNIDYLILDSISFDNELDLTKITDRSHGLDQNVTDYPKHHIFLHAVDLSKLNMDYKYFQLMLKYPDSSMLPSNEIRLLYEGLLKNFKDRGRTDSYQLLDAEYQHYRDLSLFKWQSRLNEWWWNFGYDPIKIFTHIGEFLLLFIFITFLFLETLQKKVYSLEAFEYEGSDNDNATHGNIYEWKSPKKFLMRLWYATAYASVVFLLLSIKIERLKLLSNRKYVVGTIFVIAMHMIGLICLGYVANFIFQRPS